ncbi:MAG: hypothetical protein ACK4VP_01000, partial [Nitrospira sp.]
IRFQLPGGRAAGAGTRLTASVDDTSVVGEVPAWLPLIAGVPLLSRWRGDVHWVIGLVASLILGGGISS